MILNSVMCRFHCRQRRRRRRLELLRGCLVVENARCVTGIGK